jgi:hypothetical protein
MGSSVNYRCRDFSMHSSYDVGTYIEAVLCARITKKAVHQDTTYYNHIMKAHSVVSA